MKKLFLVFCILFINNCFSQQTIYKYQVYVIDYNNPPTFKKINNQLLYNGNNDNLRSFLADYTILNFYQFSPTLSRPENLKVFELETLNSDLISKIIDKFPEIFSGYFDVTNEENELLSYPNDYGTTSPVPNLGAPINRQDLDYINIHKAWDLTTGQGMVIGISDARINVTDPDFAGKVSFINPNSYQYTPYINDQYHNHGTLVAGTAAARGNNAYGSTGVCYDCDIIGTAYGNYQNIIALADAGVRVINMSWIESSVSSVPNPNYQNIINELAENKHVILVGAAGNSPSYQTSTDWVCSGGGSNGPSFTGIQYRYPASYDNVISVSGISYKNPINLPLTNTSPSHCCDSPTIKAHLSLEDAFEDVSDATDPYNPISVIFNGYSLYCNVGLPNQYLSTPNGLCVDHTSNPKVDILAPAYDNFMYASFVEQGVIEYRGGATSTAAPYVSGTAALMLSLNECLIPNEVDNILKLTTKDVEVLPINKNFVGNIGAGALNAGDAVEFVNEMKKSNGNAIIDNHIFNRFDFTLNKINNNLTLSNVTMKDNCKSNFVAKNQIHLLPGTSLSPNTIGFTHLSINPNIVITCAPTIKQKVTDNKVNNLKVSVDSKIVLYPNPNNGNFQLLNIKPENFGNKEIQLLVYDLNGRTLFSKILSKNDIPNCEINLQYLTSGLYILKLSSGDYNEKIKFIKK